MNEHEYEAREDKVHRLIAAWEDLHRPDMRLGTSRSTVANHAGVKSPSLKTWRRFAEVVLLREGERNH